jgi:paraquat-inducible protein B
MSIRANPTAIGLFFIGAIILAVTGTAVLASTAWFDKPTKFVSFFQESVNGLENGAPVKFQGVPVGAVTGLGIQIDQRDKTFQVPVEYEIDLTRLTTQLGNFVNLADKAVLRRQIADGLRAGLGMESIVTGQLYIELSYKDGAKPPELEPHATAWPEIPTTPSLMSALGTGAGSLVDDLMKVLFQMNQMLADVNMPEINRAVVASAKAVETLMESPEITAALREVPGMTAQMNKTLAAVALMSTQAGAAVGPLQVSVESTTTEMANTLKELRRILEETHGMLSADSGLGHDMQQAMVSLGQAADALRALATALEQNPDMLLRGKKVSKN